MKDPKSEGDDENAGTDAASTVCDATTADEDSKKDPVYRNLAGDEISSDEEVPVADPADREPIPAQTIDITAPFGDNQISVIMYDSDHRISRVARTAQGTTLRFVLNEHERLWITVADPTQHDQFLASAEEDATARG